MSLQIRKNYKKQSTFNLEASHCKVNRKFILLCEFLLWLLTKFFKNPFSIAESEWHVCIIVIFLVLESTSYFTVEKKNKMKIEKWKYMTNCADITC